MTAGHGPPDSTRRRVVRSTNRRRLLVALTVTGREAAEIDGLRRALGGSGLGRIEPHVTLVPPVNVHDDELIDALRLIRSAAGEDPVGATLGPARTFAPRTPVVYLEVAGDTPRIAGLRRRLAVPPLVPVARGPERPFVPHVTIGGRVDKVKITAALAMLADFRLAATLSRVALCEQDELAPRHPWRVIADVALGSGSTVGRGGREISFVSSTILDPETTAWAAATRGEDVAGDSVPSAPADDHFALSAFVLDRPVGVVVGSVRQAAVEIRRLRVDEHRRGEGIGGQLVRTLERAAAARGCSQVVFFAVAEGPVEGFLAHLGYSRVANLAAGRDEEPLVALGRRVG